jgi:hypothetical protein
MSIIIVSMKRLKILSLAICALFIILPQSILGSDEGILDKIFEEPGDNSGYSVQQTDDNGFIITGYRESTKLGDLDIWLIKTDKSGNEEWKKTFGGTKYEEGKYAEQTKDGGYIIGGVGWTKTFNDEGSDDIILLKVNERGEKEWEKILGGSERDDFGSCCQTEDGGYILTGYTESFGTVRNKGDLILIKIDANGTELWNKTYGGRDLDWGNSIQQSRDGGYIIAGWTYSTDNKKGVVWLLKTDENGNEIWEKAFRKSNSNLGHSVQQTIDGG